jgi:hypothetical protein
MTKVTCCYFHHRCDISNRHVAIRCISSRADASFNNAAKRRRDAGHRYP